MKQNLSKILSELSLEIRVIFGDLFAKIFACLRFGTNKPVFDIECHLMT